MADERVLGVDYAILKGSGGRERVNGASVKDDESMHLSTDGGSSTICERVVESFLMTYADVEINCKECVKKLKGPKSN